MSSLKMASPVGPLELRTDSTGRYLDAVMFVDEPDASSGDAAVEATAAETVAPVLVETRRQLDRYFAGTVEHFDLPLAAQGSPFQRRVWSELSRIPFGTTASYGEVARRLGLPTSASRAVGLANGANPIAIVVPCHRVIGADGTLTGYAGGLARKQYLLELESRHAPQQALFRQSAAGTVPATRPYAGGTR